MFVKLKENRIIEEISEYKENISIPFYKVQNNFYITRWSEDEQKAMFYSPCEHGEEIAYHKKTIWMLYEIYDELLYKQITFLMLSENEAQDEADNILSYI